MGAMSGGGPGATKLGQNVPGQTISQSFIEEHLVAKTRTGKIVSEDHFDKILANVEKKMRAKAAKKPNEDIDIDGKKVKGKDIDFGSPEVKKQIIKKALKGEAKDQCARSKESFGAVFCDCNASSDKISDACKSECAWNEKFGTGGPGAKDDTMKIKAFCTDSMKT